jgi:hypothetical protein
LRTSGSFFAFSSSERGGDVGSHVVLRVGVRRVLVATLAATAVAVIATPATASAAGLLATPQFDSTVLQVGQLSRGGTITIRNLNFAAEGSATICRSDDTALGPLPLCAGSEGIVLTPSCGAQFPNVLCRPGPPSPPPSGADPDVFSIHSPAVGESGVCAGVPFTTTRVAGSELGKVLFEPPAGTHIVLPGANDSCTIRFSFDVLRAPTEDIRPLLADVQTAQVVEATEQSASGLIGSGQGSETPVTVQLATPGLATNASANVSLGAALSDDATVTGLVNPAADTAVTFKLYGPNDATCASAPVFTSTTVLTLDAQHASGTARSASFTPSSIGTYRWRATFGGDANHRVVSGACDLPSETRDVLAPVAPQIASFVAPPPTVGSSRPAGCTPRPGRAPAGGVLCARGTAKIGGPSSCTRLPFKVAITGSQISRTVFTLDGKKIRTLTKPNLGSTVYRVKIDPSHLTAKAHHVIARVTFRSTSGTQAKTLKFTFSRCGSGRAADR